MGESEIGDKGSIPTVSDDPDENWLLGIENFKKEKAASKKAIVNKSLLFIVTLALFIGLGLIKWKIGEIVLLIGVLFFHELGHWIAMRIFRYEDVRMFFIPFLGAAVSGKRRNAPSWQKAVISLAGPVPGVILGIILLIVSVASGNGPLRTAAQYLIILNGFNLLPLVPLDGGNLLRNLLVPNSLFLRYSRNVIYVASFFLAGYIFGLKILYLIGIAVAIGLPGELAFSRVLDRIRREKIGSADGKAIVGVLREKMPALFKSENDLSALAERYERCQDEIDRQKSRLRTTVIFFSGYLLVLAVAFLGFIGTIGFPEVHYRVSRDPGHGGARFSGYTVHVETNLSRVTNMDFTVSVNRTGLYHGKGVFYYSDTNRIRIAGHYSNGRMNSSWTEYSRLGNILYVDRVSNDHFIDRRMSIPAAVALKLSDLPASDRRSYRNRFLKKPKRVPWWLKLESPD